MPMQSRYAWKASSRGIPRRLLLKAAAVPAAGLVGGSVFGVARSQAGRYALPGTFIGSVDISGLSMAEANALVAAQWQDYLRNPVVFGYEEATWTPTATEIGLIVEIEEAIRAAFAREQRRMWYWFSGLSARNQVELPIFLNSTVALGFLNAIAKQIDRPPENSALERQADQVRVVPGADGKRLDREAALKLLALPSDPPQRQVVYLPVLTLVPPITLQKAEETKSVFDKLVAQGLRFELAGDGWEVPGQALTSWLQIYHNPDEGRLAVMGDAKRLQAWLEQVAVEATRPPINARLTVRDEEVHLQEPAEQGYQTDSDVLLATAQAAIEQGITALYLPAEVQEPVYTAQNMHNWGFENVIAEGASLFEGSPAERAHNIALAASKLHGYVIPPGETFSFLSVLGPITRDDGYQSSLIIFGDQTVPGVGGGVCQVSTTMFRAAFWAGLPIMERNQHSYRVGYYERDGSPPGFDAAVYDPGVDLKFVNDSEHPILIQTHVDEEAMELKFVFHGRSINRWVRMLPAVAKNWVKHGPPLPDKEDPDLPLGERLQVEWAVDGVYAEIHREVVVDGESHVDRFRSRYRPNREGWLVGTKIEEQPGQVPQLPG
ncbi:MAG: VanW family protein [Chloroflexota bacterium]|nr:VanW family protein [Chloroflexota bacterium]MDE2931591.1 VanW family protein [Chloroflexota bacterium]